jgi:NADPH-dependent curcumin reductase CurA
MTANRQILIHSLPEEKLSEANYRMTETAAPEPGAGQVLCRTLAIAITAGTRAGLQGSASYAGAPKTGIVMNGATVSRVANSRHDAFREGDLVLCSGGWQDYSVHEAGQLTRVEPGVDPAHYLGALGTNGLTAYFGMLEVGQPRSGETVLVSAAAGSVGHLAGQIARIQGCRVVGVAGADDKCRALVSELRFDEAVNYRSPGYRTEFKAACPKGVDVYFDNTGGDILGTALRGMNVGGRIACCGVVSQYDTSHPEPGPRGVPGLLINKRVRMQGFLVFDFLPRYDAARRQLRAWMDSGDLIAWQDEYQGLQRAPAAFVDLLAGGNRGTRVVRVAD